jgi:TRAP-type C4-dicarboxylate transport system permease small subunit
LTERALRPVEWAAAAILFVLMTFTAVDVAGRYVFNAPVPSAFQWVMVLMAVLVLLGLPLAAARDEHVRAGLLDHLFTGRIRFLQLPFVDALCFVALAGLAWRLWIQAERFDRAHARLPSLDFPLSAIAWIGSGAAALSALLVLTVAVRRHRP